MKVLISAYAISPYKGSEYGIGWNFVTRIAKQNSVIVLYGSSGDYIGDTFMIDEYLKNNPLQNVQFIKIESNLLIKIFDKLNHLGFPLFFYLGYRIWQYKAYIVGKRLTKHNKIDIVHQLTPMGFTSPGFLWKLGLPFVWGPVGGTYKIPIHLIKKLDWKSFLRYYIRNINIDYALKYSPFLYKVFRKSSIVFSCTHDEVKNFKKYYNSDSILLCENNIDIPLVKPVFSVSDPVRLIWIGSIDARKCLIILLEALSIIDPNLKYQLTIIGDGPLFKAMYRFASQVNINHNICWLGKINREEVLNTMKASDLHIITSLNDANPTVLSESLKFCIPTISLDHCGMSYHIKAGQGYKIKVSSFEKIISDYSECIKYFLENPYKISEMKRNIFQSNELPTWDRAMDKIFNGYKKAILDN